MMERYSAARLLFQNRDLVWLVGRGSQSPRLFARKRNTMNNEEVLPFRVRCMMAHNHVQGLWCP